MLNDMQVNFNFIQFLDELLASHAIALTTADSLRQIFWPQLPRG